MRFLAKLTNRLPMIYQSETNECGLACLAMVSSFHGKRVDLRGLRSRFGIAGLGASANQLMQFSSSLQLSGRAVSVEPDDLRRLKLPAILHWDMDHFVVLKKVSQRGITIHDPAVGIRQYKKREIGLHLTGVALELHPEQGFITKETTSRLKLGQLLAGISLNGSDIGQIFLVTLFIQLLALLNPLYLQLVIDQGLGNSDFDLIFALAFLFVLLILLKTVLSHIRGLHLLQFGNYVGFELVGSVARHLISLPLSYFERREMGDIVSRLGSLENIRRLVTQEMITILVDGAFSVITLILLYIYHPTLASIVLGFVSFNLVIRLLYVNAERDLRKECLVIGARQQSRFMENVRNILTTKINSIEDSRHGLWESAYVDHINTGFRLENLQLTLSSIQSLTFGIENILIILLGSATVIEGNISLGQLMSFMFLKQHFASSVLAMLPKYIEIKMISVELDRVSDITQESPEFQSDSVQLYKPSFDADICLQNVSFHYHGSNRSIIQKLNVDIPAGKCTAVSGISGSGKTTLLKILLGLETPNEGSVLIGGTDLKEFSAISFRKACSALLHGDGLLAGDLAYNIHLDQKPNDWQAMEEVCELVGISELIHTLPLGFATEVGEMGNIFSAGQIQRILLARALYRTPEILVLDESLSHLDTDSAIQLLNSIRTKGITTVLVTHNRNLLDCCDKEIAMR